MDSKHSKYLVGLSFIAALSLCSACARPQGALVSSTYGECDPLALPAVADYNVFVFGDLTQPSADTQGRIAVGGNAYLSNYSVGDQLSQDSSRDDLVVQGDLTYTSGAVLSGAADCGGHLTVTSSASFFGGVNQRSGVVDFNAARTEVGTISTEVAALASNGQVNVVAYSSRQQLELTGTDPVLDVFQLTSDQISSAASLAINSPAGSTVIVNVTGTTANLQSFAMTLTGVDQQHVLFHFPDATELYIGNISVEGSVIAPKANVIYPSGQLNGQFVANSMNGSGQFNQAPFAGCLPSSVLPPPTPAPSPSGTPSPSPSPTPTPTPTPGNKDCTLTIGYWKNHSTDLLAGLSQLLGSPGGAKSLNVTSVAIGEDILNQDVYGDASNGITKLYAQLLAAKLNIQQGASNAPIESTVASSDAFLATHDYLDWNSLSSADQQTVLDWQGTLDSYNNGLSGVSHCN